MITVTTAAFDLTVLLVEVFSADPLAAIMVLTTLTAGIIVYLRWRFNAAMRDMEERVVRVAEKRGIKLPPRP